MPNPVFDRNSWHQRNICSQERFTCVNKSCQRPPFPRRLHRNSPTNMRARSTTSVERIEVMLNLASTTFDIPQIWRGAIQIARLVATPKNVVNNCTSKNARITKRTVNARSEIREPCTAGNGDYDFITLPNCHAERAVVSQKNT